VRWREFISPLNAAEILFEPNSPESYSQVIEATSTWRSRLGLLAIIILSVPHDGFETIANIEGGAARTVSGAAFMTLAWLGIMRISLSSPVSAGTRKACRAVVWRVVAYYLIVGIGIAVIPLLGQIPLAGLIPLFWLYIFVLRSFWLTAKYMFGAGEAHPMLSPIVLASTVALTSLYNLFVEPAGSIPVKLNELMVLSGLATTLLISAIEFLALRHAGERFTADHFVDPPVASVGTPASHHAHAGHGIQAARINGTTARNTSERYGSANARKKAAAHPVIAAVAAVTVIGSAVVGLILAEHKTVPAPPRSR